MPFDRDRAEPVGTPLLRLAPPTDAPPVTTTDLDALGAAAEYQFGDSAARYSHADWAWEQQAEFTCNAAMRCIALGRPEVLPADVSSCFPFQQRPPFSNIQELDNEGRLHTTDAGIVAPSPCVGHATPGGSYRLFIRRRAYSHVCAAAHAPLGHAGLPFHSFLSPRNRTHPTYACLKVYIGGSV